MNITFDNPFATYNQVDPPDFVDYKPAQMTTIKEDEPLTDSTTAIKLSDLIENIKQKPITKNESYSNGLAPFPEPSYNSGEPIVAKTQSEKRKLLESVMDAQGITGEKKQTLLKIAKIESRFNMKAQSKNSSASGAFQFIDSTRKKFSSMSKKDFLNDIYEQVRCASLLYDQNKANLEQRGLPSNGEAVAMTWLNPTWAYEYLKTGKHSGADANNTNISKYLKMFRNA